MFSYKNELYAITKNLFITKTYDKKNPLHLIVL